MWCGWGSRSRGRNPGVVGLMRKRVISRVGVTRWTRRRRAQCKSYSLDIHIYKEYSPIRNFNMYTSLKLSESIRPVYPKVNRLIIFDCPSDRALKLRRDMDVEPRRKDIDFFLYR